MHTLRRPFAAVMLVAAILFAGCGGSSSTTQVATGVGAGTNTTPQSNGTLYLTPPGGELLVRSPVAGPGNGPGRYLRLLRLLATSADSPLPHGTTVRSAHADGDVLTVDFSRKFKTGYPSGGAAAENLILGSIVFSVTGSFPEINGVTITIDGVTPDLLTQYDLASPIRPTDLPADLLAVL
jgi:Sporulation and spore germination